jgi:glycosidase
MLGYYQRAIAYRKMSRALRLGDVETAVIDDESRVYVFTRRAGDEVVYAAFNASDRPASVTIPLRPGEAGAWRDALGLCPPPESGWTVGRAVAPTRRGMVCS